MKRYKLTIQYDGTNYCGWQVQKNGKSVQSTIINAVESFIDGEVKLVGSGRTDAGVHARGQVAHLDITTSIPSDRLAKAINAKLPDDISILSSQEVSQDFHARYSAKRKTYVYKIYVSDKVLPLYDRYALRIDKMPDLALILECAKILVGEHDFRCFLASGSAVKDTVREIYSLDIDSDGQFITVKICGNGFLYNMVRIIVGTLLEVGYGKRSIQEVKNALINGQRQSVGKTVCAKGLELYSVEY